MKKSNLRTLCTVTSLVILSMTTFSFAKADEQEDYLVKTTPHADALVLVLQTQAEKIQSLEDTQLWWHDVKTRQWSVQRPFYPGTIDSTHLFSVTYLIDGKPVCSWLVDTRTRSVQIAEEPDKTDE